MIVAFAPEIIAFPHLMRTGRLPILILFLLANAQAYAQMPVWSWAQAWGGNSYDEGNCIATDASGNVYTGGEFYSPSMASLSSVTTITNSGTPGYDFYVIKYTATGSVVWAKDFGQPTGNDKIAGIATDAVGNVYITGSSTSSSLTLGSYTLTNPGAYVGAFIAKLDPLGNVLWARMSGITSTTGEVTAIAITIDGSGNAIASGVFTCPSISFGTDTLDCSVPMYSDFYVVKYDPSGNCSWAKGFGGINSDLVMGIATDPSDNICLTGYFNSTSIAFGSYILTNSVSNPNPIFVAKMDPAGSVVWASSGDGNAIGTGIASDKLGNILVTGIFTATFVLGGTTLTSLGGHDIFVAKYNAAGILQWAKRNGGTGVDRTVGLVADTIGNAYVTGYYTTSTMTFGDSTLSNPASGSDIFIAKYDGAGNAAWSMTAKSGTVANDHVKAIAADRSANSIYITGYTLNDTMRFGSVNMMTPTGSDQQDVFIAKVQVPVTAVPIVAGASSVKIYPNPAANDLTIEGEGISEVAVIDMEGKVLFRRKYYADRVSVDVSVLAPGAYVIVVVDNGGTTTNRVIKC